MMTNWSNTIIGNIECNLFIAIHFLTIFGTYLLGQASNGLLYYLPKYLTMFTIISSVCLI